MNAGSTYVYVGGAAEERSVMQGLPNDQLARTISEAAFDPVKWVDVCDGFAQLTGGCGSLLITDNPGQNAIGVPHSASLGEAFKSYIDGGWYTRDLRLRAIEQGRKKGYMTDADCLTYDEIGKSDFYQDFLSTQKLSWFVAIPSKVQESQWAISIQRRLGREPFTQDEIDKAVAYRSLLNTSAAIARHLGFARALGAANVLEQHGLCAIALDANYRVVHVSPSAERHLHDCFRLVEGKLSARHAPDEASLRRLMSGICGKDLASSNFHVALRRSDGRPPLVLYGCSLPEVGCDIFHPAVALLVISDPEVQQGIPPDLLIDYFGMTRAEARLAISLHLGASVEKHAADNGLSPVTVRNHLQELFRKTSTHRQADLIAVLNRVIPRK